MTSQQQTRRSFLQTSSLALSATLLPDWLQAESNGKKQFKHLGVQLYSVQDQMKKSPLDTLRQVAAIGYKEVEPAGYENGKVYGLLPADFRKACNDLGITIPTSHYVFGKSHFDKTTNDITDTWKRAIADAKTMGQRYIISPWFDVDKNNLDDVKRGLDQMNRCGQRCQEAGLKFGFHNHHQEFVTKHDGKLLYQIMLEQLDPTLVTQQLDTCNMKIGNADAVEWLTRYPKSFELIHVKDKAKGRDESTTLGQGELDMKAIFAACRKTNIQYYVIEVESYDGITPMQAVQINYGKMKEFGA